MASGSGSIRDGTHHYVQSSAVGGIGSNTKVTNLTFGTGRGGVGTYLVDSTQYATQAVPPAVMGQYAWGIREGFSVDYAKTDPTFTAVVMALPPDIYVSHNSGSEFSWRLLASVLYGCNSGMIAIQSPTNMVVFPNGGAQLLPVYTTDGRTFNNSNSWTLSAANGGYKLAVQPLHGGWSGNQLSYRHFVCADYVNHSAYYAYNLWSGPWRRPR